MKNTMQLTFDRLRLKYGQDLTDKQHEYACGAIERFVVRAYVKFAAGAKEHHEDFGKKAAIKDMLWESIDQYFYSDLICQQALNSGVVYSETEKKCQKRKSLL
jgi:hypothetical protein